MVFVLFFLSVLSAIRSETLTTNNPIIGVVCSESQDGMAVFVPHPTNCSLYYECVGLTPVLMSCPGDLYFHPDLHICTWPGLVDCEPTTKTVLPETTPRISTPTIPITTSEDLTNTEAVIITGGRAGAVGAGGFKSVEVILGDGTTCSLPDLPANTEYHSQSGLVTCGGGTDLSVGVDDTYCTTFTNGSWITTHNLTVPRRFHTSWNSDMGIILIGGAYFDNATRSTELLSNTSSTSTLEFALPYDTRYLGHVSNSSIN